MDENYDIEGWATKCNIKCMDGRTIMENAFQHQDGQTVPVVWNHDHNNPENVLGHALLENRPEGVYAYVKFNDTESGKVAKSLTEHKDITRFSICAGGLKQQGSNVVHGIISEVSLVLAGANPGAVIESVMKHSAEEGDEAIIVSHDEFQLKHGADDKTKEQQNTKESGSNVEGKSIKEIIDGMSDEQKEVMYFLVGRAVEDAKTGKLDNVDDKDEGKTNDKVEHGLEQNETFTQGGYQMNLFEQNAGENQAVLTHSDEVAIIKMAVNEHTTSFQDTLKKYMSQNQRLAHSIDDIDKLFPEYTNLNPGAPELLTRDYGFVDHVINGAHKTPFSRIRTRVSDARKAEIRAKGYVKGKEKTNIGNLDLLERSTDPQTVFVKDQLDRDDITDITDFDVVAYQYKVMNGALKEELAVAILIGDGRAISDKDKIKEDNIRSIWNDDDVYTIHGEIDFATMKKELQGTNTSANFGDEYIYAEAIIKKALFLRESYKGSGDLELYCTPHMLNVMLLARDLNGRRIYNSKDDLAKALNVKDIVTVEQFEGRTRSVTVKGAVKTKQILGLFVNMADYNIGSTKGGEITKFSDFDIDFNRYKYLMETRLSGALVKPYSAIALEEDVTVEAASSGHAV